MHSNQKHARTLTFRYKSQWIAAECILGSNESWAVVGPLPPLHLSLRGAKMDCKRGTRWMWLKAWDQQQSGECDDIFPFFDTSGCGRWGCCYILVRPTHYFSKKQKNRASFAVLSWRIFFNTSIRWYILLFPRSTLCILNFGQVTLWGKSLASEFIFFLSGQFFCSEDVFTESTASGE